MKRLYLALCFCLPITLVSCGGNPTVQTPASPQNAYLAVARSLRQILETDRSFVNAVIKANGEKLIPDSTAKTLLEMGVNVAKAGDQANVLIRGMVTLPPGTKVSVWSLLKPISDVVNGSIASGLVPIQDPDTRATVSSLLLTIQTSLAIIQLQTAQ